MHVFYTPDINNDVNYTLDIDEARHCIKVLRIRKGSRIILVDGRGGYYEAELTDTDIKECRVRILKHIGDYGKRDYKVHLAIAPTKNISRFEWCIEKATEMGVDEITPIVCEHAERTKVKTERLERIIVASMKQSVKAYKPTLNSITKFDDFIESASLETGYIAHCYKSSKQPLKIAYKKGNDAILMIGPEGDFSMGEIERATAKGYTEVLLGNERLRTETAGVLAIHTIHLVNQ